MKKYNQYNASYTKIQQEKSTSAVAFPVKTIQQLFRQHKSTDISSKVQHISNKKSTNMFGNISTVQTSTSVYLAGDSWNPNSLVAY